MSSLATYNALREIATAEFADLVVNAQILCLPTGDPLKLRLNLVDDSLLDVYLSSSGRYSYHWDRRLTPAGDLYRHDNAPHDPWRRVATFPRHFHDGNENNVIESHLDPNPERAIHEVLTFVRQKLTA
jgi:hypothetical protein